MKAFALACAILFCSYSPGFSQQTGIGLFKDCTGNQADKFECQAYFLGFFEGFIVSGSLQQNGICLPPAVSANQVRAISEKYFKDHPEELHLLSAVLIKKALRVAFACKSSN